MQSLETAVRNTVNTVLKEVSAVEDEKQKKLHLLRANLGKIVSLPIEEIELNENIRKSINFSAESFQRLKVSIREFGILENAVVELREQEGAFKLVCIAGHRRILAARALGSIPRISCLVLPELGEPKRVGSALSENLNREDLHCLDVGEGYQKLLQGGWSEERIATNFCRDARTIRHYVKMAEWPEKVKDLIRKHPEVFSTRTLMREFAYRRFASSEELRQAIEGKIAQKASPVTVSLRKEKLRAQLNDYFQKRSDLSQEVRQAVNEVLNYLKLL